MPKASQVVAALAIFLSVTIDTVPAFSATYYVDPTTGNNQASGTAASSAWKNPPGTRRADNSGFYSASWGAISPTNKVRCGDVILLKPGATQTAASGGAWLIDETYYESCTATSPIRIKVASESEWPNTAGPFTIDGAGITPTWSPTRGWFSHPSLITIADRGHIYLLGAGSSRRLVTTNSIKWAITVQCSGCTNSGFRGDWWELKNGAGGGFNIGRYSDWQVSNSIAHDLRLGGWQTGMNNDQFVERGAFVDVEVYRTGPPDTMTGADDAFFLTGGKSVWCVRCITHDNNQRGVNTGVIANSANVPFNFRFRDLVSYNNGLACSLTAPVLYCDAAGFDVSGNEWAASAKIRNVLVRAQLFGNGFLGTKNYAAAELEIWNATYYRNNVRRSDTGSHVWDTGGGQLWQINSVDMGAVGMKAYGYGNSLPAQKQACLTPIVRNSCFRPPNSDQDTIGIGAACGPGSGTYANPPGFLSDASNLLGITACDPKFASLHDSDFSQVDFTPLAGSSLIDRGRFFLLADGAGTDATTITVKSNGGSGDPRDFFIGADSYLDPAPEDRQIQIEGCGVRTVVSMTANSVTFTPACSWANNAGVHLPWTGARPDIGAIEVGIASPGGGTVPPPPGPAPLEAPRLMSVEPLPN